MKAEVPPPTVTVSSSVLATWIELTIGCGYERAVSCGVPRWAARIVANAEDAAAELRARRLDGAERRVVRDRRTA